VYAGSSLRALTDDALLVSLDRLVAQERESAADIVEHLVEVDRRELAVDRAYPSLFVYCVKKLGYSEAAAISRIRAAHAAASFPDVLTRLRSGHIHLEAIVRLSPYLDRDNSRELLNRATGASKREVLSLVAELQTEPAAQRDVVIPVRARVGDVPAGRVPTVDAPDGPSSGDSSPVEIVPALRHRFHFAADAELLEMIGRLRGLLRHRIPDGSLELIFKEAVKDLLARLDREKRASPERTAKPAASSASGDRRRDGRLVPKTVKRFVWERDGGRCAYTAPDGRRCESRDALEYDHIIAWADGGRSDTPENIRLLCRAHNQRLGRRRFGPRRRRQR
jgi:hypothetical protein